MAFTVPTFPLTVEIFAGPWLTRVTRGTSPGNLALGRRGMVFADNELVSSHVYTGPAYLLVPALTDIRDVNCSQTDNDVVEVPQGSGRWYGVAWVDDVGKGFPNEHRVASLYKISANTNGTLYPGLFWPSPIP